MEKENIIDRSGEQLLKLPRFSPISIILPNKIAPFSIKPIQKIKYSQNILLSTSILQKTGVKVQSSGLLSNILSCNQCNVCKALSKQTLEEMNQQELGQIQYEQNKQYKQNYARKNNYQKIWKQIKKKSTSIPRTNFNKIYQDKGYLSSSEWKKQVQNIFT